MIAIITVYKSHNYGSYLQAKALYEVCRKFDEDVCFLDAGQRQFLTWNNFKWICTGIIRKHEFATLRLFWNTFRYWHRMKSITLHSALKRDDITFVVGSDEIWNVKRDNCNLPLFRGEQVNGRIISYAPSINDSTEEELRQNNFEQALSRFAAISVRDSRSQRIITNITSLEIPVVLDPTLLFDMEFYLPNKLQLTAITQKYIALYLFDLSLSANQIGNIRQFAQKEHLLLVSIGLYIEWCDLVVSVPNFCPFLYYKDAECVITNTFHGTAFAINFGSQFVTIPNGNAKTMELLSTFGLEERDASLDVSFSDFENRMKLLIDYTVVNERKKRERERALAYLQSNLAG